MRVLVCSKLSIPSKNLYLPNWDYANSIGHQVDIVDDGVTSIKETDAIILMGIGALPTALKAVKKFPNAPLYVYNWDCYEWCWKNPRPGEYDYKGYYQLLKQAKEVWAASTGTARRMQEEWDIEASKIILCNCPWWYSPLPPKDDGYILYPLRQVPDKSWGRFEEACSAIGLPYVMTRHRKTYGNYQEKVANCKFIVSDLYEMSTGGLTLLEGYYLGKPCLLTDSKWHGGKDYLGDRATYFEHGNFEEYKDKLWEMFTHTPKVATDHKEFITENYSDKRMIDQILDRISI